MKRILSILFLIALLPGCAIMQKTGQMAGIEHTPEVTVNKMQKEFDTIPAPASRKVSVAVYSFQDKTGQRKTQTGVASFSMAVTQGAEVFLIKALQDVGHGEWFDVVERVGIDNIVKERTIIKQMRDAYEGKEARPLMPLQFAGLIMEGGIIGYDSSTESGGAAYRWLGIGPQTQYSKDIVTISLRAISVNTGKVVAAVHVTKTVYSTADSFAMLKFFSDGTQAFEAETGLTINEPGTLAIKTTIEAAVVELIKEGERKGVWDYRKQEAIPIVMPLVIPEVKKQEKVADLSENKKTEAVTVSVTKMYTKDKTRVYDRNSELITPPFGSYTVYPKDTEFTVNTTEFATVVEVTDSNGKKGFVRKENLIIK